MIPTATPTILDNVAGIAPTGEVAELAYFIKPERYALVWWHPQALTPAACKTCNGSAEPIKLIMDIHEAGCEVVGLTYDRPESVRRYQQDIGLEYPILSVTESAALKHGAAKTAGESWQGIPHRVAFLIDEHRQVINRYEVHEVKTFLRTVLGDVKAGPPPVKWEQPKRKKFLGIF